MALHYFPPFDLLGSGSPLPVDLFYDLDLLFRFIYFLKSCYIICAYPYRQKGALKSAA
jgi:hypothetical protein